jgi:hypothetical protein
MEGCLMFDSMELVAIKKLGGKVTQPIDPEFLPPGYGGGGSLIVNVVVGEDMASIASADKTYDEILNAFSSGVIPFAKVLLPEATGSMCLAAPMGVFNPGGYQCTFMCPTPFGNFTVTVENNDAWSLTTPE